VHAIGQRHADCIDAWIVEHTLEVGGGVGVAVAVGRSAGELDVRVDDHRRVDLDTLESGGHRYVAIPECMGLARCTRTDEGDSESRSF
jgi:hypothetical protein